MAPAEITFSYFVCNGHKSASERNGCWECETGRWENGRARLSAAWSFRVISPPSLPSLRFHVSSRHLLLLVQCHLRKSLVSSPPSSSPDHPGFSRQKKILPFPLCMMNTPDEHDSQGYPLFENITRFLDLRQRKWLEFLNLFKLWPFHKLLPLERRNLWKRLQFLYCSTPHPTPRVAERTKL